MRKLLPLCAGLSAVAVWAWACSDDATPGSPTLDGGAPDSTVQPVPTSTTPAPDTGTPPGVCDAIDASVPSGDYGNPNANAPADAGQTYVTVPFPAENAYSYEKAILGKILFWEEQLSSDDTVACGSCHHPSAGGSDPRAATARHPGADGVLNTDDDPHGALGIARCDDSSGTVVRKADAVFGMNVQVTRRKPPSYLDAMFAQALFWDGRATDAFADPEKPGTTVIATGGALESQAVAPPLNPAEMACENRTWAKVEAKLSAAKPLAKAKSIPDSMAAAICKSPTYGDLFKAAFGTPDITAARIAMAIATHERTLLSNQTPFDRDVAGDATALTAGQARGRDLFFGKALCQRCHQRPLLGFTAPGPQFFANLGFENDAGIAFDRGRAEFTDAGADIGAFRTVSIRNAGLREAAGLLHDGIGAGMDLPKLISHYSQAPAANYNTSPIMTTPLNLTSDEQTDLVDFVRNALTDPRVQSEHYPFDRPKLGSE
jgi:cytochrome c peroxidase